MRKRVREYILLIIGTALLAMATGIFYNPNKMIVGGFAGIGIIVEAISSSHLGFTIPVSVTNLVLNVPLILIALKFRGKEFIVKTAFATVLYSGVMEICTFLPKYTGDMMLVAIYGGLMQGAGLAFVVMARGSTGGVDLLSNIIHRFLGYISISKIIFTIDCIIIAGGLFNFGIDNTMYGILSIFIGTKCMGAILDGMKFSKVAFIVSKKSNEIAHTIMEKVDRGVTALNGRGMYTGNSTDVLLCVFAQKEITVIKEIVSEIDKDAFVLVTDVKEALGNGFADLIEE